MHWIALAYAAGVAAVFVLFQFFPGYWCEPVSVRLGAGLFVVIICALYLWLVDDERRPKAGAWHRILVGATAWLLLALIAGGPPELYPLLGLLGGVAGYLGFRWLRHLPL